MDAAIEKILSENIDVDPEGMVQDTLIVLPNLETHQSQLTCMLIWLLYNRSLYCRGPRL